MGTLVNAIKAIFASKKTTDSNYAVPLLNKSDASPAGYMELPDITKIFCGLKSQTIPDGTDLNTITEQGVYKVISKNSAQTLQNTPYKNGGFVLYRISPYDAVGYGAQIVISHEGIWWRPGVQAGVSGIWRAIDIPQP
jgi:hypothetical protein